MPPAVRLTPETLVRLAFVLVGSGVVAVLSLHALEPAVDPLVRPLSDYEDTPHHGLMTFTYATVGLAGVCMGVAMREGLADSRRARSGALLLAIAAVAVVAFAVWPDGWLHRALVSLALGLMLVAISILVTSLRQDDRLRSFRVFSWTVVGLAACGIAGIQTLLPWPGLIQRVYYFAVLVWFGVAGRTVLRATPEGFASGTAPQRSAD